MIKKIALILFDLDDFLTKRKIYLTKKPDQINFLTIFALWLYFLKG